MQISNFIRVNWEKISGESDFLCVPNWWQECSELPPKNCLLLLALTFILICYPFKNPKKNLFFCDALRGWSLLRCFQHFWFFLSPVSVIQYFTCVASSSFFSPCFSCTSSLFYSIQKCKILELIEVKHFYRMDQHINLCTAEFFLITSFFPSGSFPELPSGSSLNNKHSGYLFTGAVWVPNPPSTKSWEKAVDSGGPCQESGARVSLSPFLSGDARK